MPPCGGPWQKAHLIRQQTLKREHLEAYRWKAAVWVWACHDHHAAFDSARTIRLPRSVIPMTTERFAQRHDLVWYLDQNYK